MDEEIKFRYRELENRPERHRLERLDQAQRALRRRADMQKFLCQKIKS